jgi:hypothetical protein
VRFLLEKFHQGLESQATVLSALNALLLLPLSPISQILLSHKPQYSDFNVTFTKSSTLYLQLPIKKK